jgi:hypothetical protein
VRANICSTFSSFCSFAQLVGALLELPDRCPLRGLGAFRLGIRSELSRSRSGIRSGEVAYVLAIRLLVVLEIRERLDVIVRRHLSHCRHRCAGDSVPARCRFACAGCEGSVTPVIAVALRLAPVSGQLVDPLFSPGPLAAGGDSAPGFAEEASAAVLVVSVVAPEGVSTRATYSSRAPKWARRESYVAHR